MGLRREGEGSGQGARAGACALTCTDPTEHRKALAVVVSAVCDVYRPFFLEFFEVGRAAVTSADSLT